jgi:methyl-accepting chemotaxis protein
MLKNLKIWQKFTLIAVAFSLPILALSTFLILETNKTIEFTRAELDGTQVLRPLHKLAADVAASRDLASAVLAGDVSFKPDLDKRQEMVEADLKELAAADDRYGFANPEDLQAVTKAWAAIRAGLPAWKLEQSFEEHTKFLRMVEQFTVLIGNASNLILDPRDDSHYLVDALVFRIPKITSEVSGARSVGVAFFASGGQGDVNSQRRSALAEAAVKINDALFQATSFIRFATGKAHPRTDEALGIPVSDMTKAVKAWNELLINKVVNGTGELIPVKDYFAAATAPLDAAGKLWDATVAELDRLLGERNAALSKNRMLEIGVVLAALLLTILFLTVVVRAITRPIAHLSEVAERISLGEMDATINVETKDEIGELGERFRRLQVSLKAAMDALESRDDDQG